MRWVPTYKDCPQWQPTEIGMTEFVKRHRDLPYCANEGRLEGCTSCVANCRNGYGDATRRPTIRFTKSYTNPF